MKNFLIATLVFVLWSTLTMASCYFLMPDLSLNLSNKQDNTSVQDTVPIANLLPPPTIDPVVDESINKEAILSIVDVNDQEIKTYNTGIEVSLNQKIVEVPDTLKEIPSLLRNHLENNPDTELHILSKYNPGEAIEVPNLAQQRAADFEKLLITTGIPKELIVITTSLDTSPLTEEGKIANAFDFQFKPLDQNRISTTESILPPAKTYYFTQQNNELITDNALKGLLAEVKKVLSENPNATVTIIGHADNVETYLSSYKQGLEYARQVKWYLTSNSRLNRDRIQAISKGKSVPIATNRTPSGRKKNKRIEIVYNIINQQ